MSKSIEVLEEEAAQNMATFVGNPHDQGWYFPAGDPEFWKFSERMLVKGGRALDLGIGDGRTSWFFALHGMEVTDKAIEALKPEGHLWIRAGGKYDSSYEELGDYAGLYPEITWLDEDTFMAPCSCSGELRIEPQLFLNPIETLLFVASRGLKIIHTQIMPESHRSNIMFGEDFNRSRPNPPTLGGLITILAQK